MRPVTRGAAPRTYNEYGDAIGDLEKRLGIYCSYCERRLPVSLAAEHVAPKCLVPGREVDWSNFLLGCTNCNSVKSDKPTSDDGFLWPDRDNTFRAFEYCEGGYVRVRASLVGTLHKKAAALKDLVGLDRHKKRGWPRPARRDKRWEQREQCWRAAELCRDRLQRLNHAEAARDIIVEAAVGLGFFSVWITVFADDAAMKRALIDGFTGTAQDSFDAGGSPMPRPNGRI